MVSDEQLIKKDETVVAEQSLSGSVEDRLVGSVFAQKYQILEFLGRGGMSVVYRARHLMMAKEVALKVLHAHLCENATSIRRFKQEALAVSALTHPNIVSVHDFGSDENGMPYLVMDYVDGASLSQSIKTNGPLELERFLSIMRQVASALEHAHSHKVVHRDLKPSNIMISSSGGKDTVKIVDFGIAKIAVQGSETAQQLTQTGELFGSPLYMSPEQCSGIPLDSRSDIYAFGCVMYEALSGKPPYLGDNVFETINKHLNDTPPPLEAAQIESATRQRLELLILKAMAKSPADRYQSAAEIESVLRSLSLSTRTGVFARLGGAWDLASAKRAARRKNKLPLLVTTLTSVSFLSMVSMICLLGAFIDSDYQSRKLSDSRQIITENSLIQLEFIKMGELGESYVMRARKPETLAKYRSCLEIFRHRLEKTRSYLKRDPRGLQQFMAYRPEINSMLSESWKIMDGLPKNQPPSWSDYQSGLQLKSKQVQGMRILNTLSTEAKTVDAQEVRVENSRVWILYLSILCVLLNAAVMISLIIYFARGTPRRLKELAEQAARLSNKKRSEGDDEIAELDFVLQELASALSEAEQREQALLGVVKVKGKQDGAKVPAAESADAQAAADSSMGMTLKSNQSD